MKYEAVCKSWQFSRKKFISIFVENHSQIATFPITCVKEKRKDKFRNIFVKYSDHRYEID